jgi:hypothetical protein
VESGKAKRVTRQALSHYMGERLRC